VHGSHRSHTGETPISTASGGIVQVVVDQQGRVPWSPRRATTTADAVRQAKDDAGLGADGILRILKLFPAPEAGWLPIHAIADSTDRPRCSTPPQLPRSDLTLPRSHASPIRHRRHQGCLDHTGRLCYPHRTEGQMEVFAASAHIPLAVMMIGQGVFCRPPAPSRANRRCTSCAAPGNGMRPLPLQRRSGG